MPFFLGDHNRPIVELYVAEFDTDDGPLILECWSMDPVNAAAAFMKFFSVDHPDRSRLTDRTRLDEHLPRKQTSYETLEWWREKPVWTGDYVELAIDPETRVTIGKTVIEYSRSSYWSWSNAYKSPRSKVSQTEKWSLRNHAIQERLLHSPRRSQSC